MTAKSTQLFHWVSFTSTQLMTKRPQRTCRDLDTTTAFAKGMGSNQTTKICALCITKTTCPVCFTRTWWLSWYLVSTISSGTSTKTWLTQLASRLSQSERASSWSTCSLLLSSILELLCCSQMQTYLTQYLVLFHCEESILILRGTGT
jgi:hypothetical protein